MIRAGGLLLIVVAALVVPASAGAPTLPAPAPLVR